MYAYIYILFNYMYATLCYVSLFGRGFHGFWMILVVDLRGNLWLLIYVWLCQKCVQKSCPSSLFWRTPSRNWYDKKIGTSTEYTCVSCHFLYNASTFQVQQMPSSSPTSWWTASPEHQQHHVFCVLPGVS